VFISTYTLQIAGKCDANCFAVAAHDRALHNRPWANKRDSTPPKYLHPKTWVLTTISSSSLYSSVRPTFRQFSSILSTIAAPGIGHKSGLLFVSLEEYPTLRYFRPQNLFHEAQVSSELLAKDVQTELDPNPRRHPDFPPPSNTRGVLFVVDRSMYLFAPALRVFTYQTMAHDLLPIKDGEKVTYIVKFVGKAARHVGFFCFKKARRLFV